jgi:P27 family predicted phage terminase small subunit
MPGGRPRKSDAQKKKEGTFRKDRAAPPSAQFSVLSKIPAAPDSFDEIAVKVWNTICGELINLGLMQSIDIFQVEIICNELSIYWKCMKAMGTQLTVDTGTGSTKVNPLYTAATSALNNFNRLAKDFGFSPAARLKLRVAAADSKPKENKALTLINRKKALK